MTRRLASAVLDRLVIVAYGAGPPTEHEWLGYLRLVERQALRRLRTEVAGVGER